MQARVTKSTPAPRPTAKTATGLSALRGLLRRPEEAAPPLQRLREAARAAVAAKVARAADPAQGAGAAK